MMDVESTHEPGKQQLQRAWRRRPSRTGSAAEQREDGGGDGRRTRIQAASTAGDVQAPDKDVASSCCCL